MLAVIATACVAFGLTVSEAKTEIMCLQTKVGAGGMPFAVTAAGQVHKQMAEFCVLGRGDRRRLIGTSHVSR